MNESAQLKRVLRFGVFQVDADAGELFKHGIKIKLQDQPFQVLIMLLDAAGEVVSREAIRQRLWPENTFVDFDHSLNIAVNKLRDALGDSADNPRFVETLPRRGYRFLVPVTVEGGFATAKLVGSPAPVQQPFSPTAKQPRLEKVPWEGRTTPEEASRAHAWGKLVIGALVVAVLLANWAWKYFGRSGTAPPAKRMVAVLPLENLSQDSKEEYFIAGLQEELISQIGRVQATQLGVIARTSVLQYKGSTKPIQQIGRELNVDYVMEGAVRRSGERIRITLQLIKADDQTQLWSEQYERMVADVISIQTDVARRVADALALELLPNQRAALERAATTDMGAYEDYLRGRFQWNQRTEDGFLRAIFYFEDALRKDPKFAQAYAGLADAYNLMGGYGFQPPSQAFPKAKAAAARALELNPELAEAHAALGFARFYFDWDWKGAEESFRRGLEANPNYPPVRQWYAEFLHAMSRFDQADAQFRWALELDPFSLALNDDVGWLLLSRKRNDEAITQFRKAQTLDPTWASGYTSLAFALARAGQTKEALAELDHYRQRSGDVLALHETLGYVRALAGDRNGAGESLGVLRQHSNTVYVSPYSIALVHVALNEKSAAVAELRRGLQGKAPWLVWLKSHPEWDALRSEPAFRELLREVGF